MIGTGPLGRTSLAVSRLGLGTTGLGGLTEAEAFALLDAAYALGVRVFDTAPSYGRAELLLGRWRRKTGHADVVVSTKVGYGVPGVEDWTGASVALGIDQALRTLSAQRLELVHLHSCSGVVALRDDIQRAIGDALDAGKITVAAYAGENEDLDAALASPLFGAVQLSVSLVDQGSRELRLADLARRGIGVIAKRTLGNGPWSAATPTGDGPEAEYQRRFAQLELPPPDDGAWAALALRFAAYSPGVDVALVGTRSIDRLREAAEAIEAGPLPNAVVDAIVARWRARALGWRGVV